MESCSSSPGPKMESRQDTEASPHNSQYSGTQVTLQAPQWLVNGTTTTTTSTSNSEEREREYHRMRLAQLQQEGAVRLQVLEAELALQHQHQHMLQQQHQLKMKILMEKLKRVRENTSLND
ncbi:hypothetical protein OTU49_011494 [Cherax quadricarinatus]